MPQSTTPGFLVIAARQSGDWEANLNSLQVHAKSVPYYDYYQGSGSGGDNQLLWSLSTDTDEVGRHTWCASMVGQQFTVTRDGVVYNTATAPHNTTGYAGIRFTPDINIYNVSITCLGGSECEPQPTGATMSIAPTDTTVTVGQPFSVDLTVEGTGYPFNAAEAEVTVSSNLDVVGVTSASCNLSYTQTPSVSDLSFAGAIYNGSSESCSVFTVTVVPNTAGTGTISLSNASVKSYSDHSEILESAGGSSYTIVEPTATPTPTPLSELTIDYPFVTYESLLGIGGTKDELITQVFLNGSDTGVAYPTTSTWTADTSLVLGENTIILYGKDAQGNQTATQSIVINRHTLGDINGDGLVSLIDASLFAVDWGKTENLTYSLSDMDGNGSVDLVDLSILAKLLQD